MHEPASPPHPGAAVTATATGQAPRAYIIHFSGTMDQRFHLEDVYLVPEWLQDDDGAAQLEFEECRPDAKQDQASTFTLASPFARSGCGQLRFQPSKVQCATCQAVECTWAQESRKFECQGCTSCPRCTSCNILMKDRKQVDKYRLQCTNCGFSTPQLDIGALQSLIRASQPSTDADLRLSATLLELQQSIRRRETTSVSAAAHDELGGNNAAPDDASPPRSGRSFSGTRGDSAVINSSFAAATMALAKFNAAFERATRELLAKPCFDGIEDAPTLADVAQTPFLMPRPSAFVVPTRSEANPHRIASPEHMSKAMLHLGSGITLDGVCAGRGMVGADGAPATSAIAYKLLRSLPAVTDVRRPSANTTLYAPSTMNVMNGDMSSSGVGRLYDDATRNVVLGAWMAAARHIATVRPAINATSSQSSSGSQIGYFMLSNLSPHRSAEVIEFSLAAVEKGASVAMSLASAGGSGGGAALISLAPHAEKSFLVDFVDGAFAAEIDGKGGHVVVGSRAYFRVVHTAGARWVWKAVLRVQTQPGRFATLRYFVFVS